MEKKTADRQGIEQTAVSMLKALLCAYVVTGIMLLILTILLYKAGLSEENVNAGIILTYVISTFAGGFVIGKLMKVKKFLWGIFRHWSRIYFCCTSSKSTNRCWNGRYGNCDLNFLFN